LFSATRFLRAFTPPFRGFTPKERACGADANHRYTSSRIVRDQMTAKGWLAEGDGPDLMVMCSQQ